MQPAWHLPLTRTVQGIVFRGVNTSLLDGFDVAFTKLLFGEFLGTAVEFYPYPDSPSLCAHPLTRRKPVQR